MLKSTRIEWYQPFRFLPMRSFEMQMKVLQNADTNARQASQIFNING